jgi:hypothetical protein
LRNLASQKIKTIIALLISSSKTASSKAAKLQTGYFLKRWQRYKTCERTRKLRQLFVLGRNVGAISLESDGARFFDMLVMNSLLQKFLDLVRCRLAKRKW